MKLEYNPPPSVQGFLASEAFISLIVGPVGSTKTTAGLMKIVYHAKQMAKAIDGVRRSRCVWIRNTNEQLLDTSIPDFHKWFPPGVAGSWAKQEKRFILKFDDVECEVLFRGLDDANDVRRLLSLQASFAVLDEFREIHPDIFEALQGRLGRYPDGMLVPHRPEWGVDSKGNPIQGCVTDEGKPNAHVWGMTNPPDFDTYWEKILTEPPDNAACFFQPSGLSENADWVQYLPADYYENLAEGKNEDWIDVYIHAKFGKSLSGQPVFKAFRMDFHVAKSALKPIRVGEYPLIIGADFGLCYSDDTEVLTSSGWKFFRDVDEKVDRVATLNPKGFELEYTDINFKVEYDYDGELIEFKSQNFNFLVTPEHRTPFTRRDSPHELVFASAAELENRTNSHNYVQLQAHWQGQAMNWCGLPDDVAAEFLGWYVSEGSIEIIGGRYRVSIDS